MAPTPEEVIDSLKGTVDKLEARVAELEGKLKGAATGVASSSSDGMRMILMGPPGAGKNSNLSYGLVRSIEIAGTQV
jgi:adenylate kinase